MYMYVHILSSKIAQVYFYPAIKGFYCAGTKGHGLIVVVMLGTCYMCDYIEKHAS